MQDSKFNEQIKSHSGDRLKYTTFDNHGTRRGAQAELDNNAELHSELHIRRANIYDVTTICDLGRRQLSVTHQVALASSDMQNFLDESFNEDRVRSELQSSDSHYWMAQQDSNICGMIKLKNASPAIIGLGRRALEISRLYLEPESIGKGVGSALMQHVLGLASDNKYDVCWLLVWAENIRAVLFYKRWGFALVRTIQYQIGNSYLQAHIMTCCKVKTRQHNLQLS